MLLTFFACHAGGLIHTSLAKMDKSGLFYGSSSGLHEGDSPWGKVARIFRMGIIIKPVRHAGCPVRK